MGNHKFTLLTLPFLGTMNELLITMKNLVSFITLIFFLHSSTNYNMIGADYELYDTGMEHLLAGTPYYIVPVRSGGGGGLFFSGANTTCYVVQQPIDDLPSQAVIFNHDKSEVGDWLTASTDLNIKFEVPFGCASSSSVVLQVNTTDETTGQHFITAGGVEGNPGCGTIPNWFQIEKLPSDYSYKLIYCPSVCDLVNVTCRDVGAFDRVGFGFPRLFLSDSPLLVRFHKAHPCGSNKL